MLNYTITKYNFLLPMKLKAALQNLEKSFADIPCDTKVRGNCN